MDHSGHDMSGMDHSGHNMSDMGNTSATNMSSCMESMSHSMSMPMAFYWGPQVTILFSSWTTSSWGPYMGSLLVCLLLAVIYEGLSTFRIIYAAKMRARMRMEQEVLADVGGENGGSSKAKPSVAWIAQGSIVDRLLAALMIGTSAAVSYLLMLMVMSFNVGVFLAVVIGHALGVLLFGGVRVLTESSLFADSHCGGW